MSARADVVDTEPERQLLRHLAETRKECARVRRRLHSILADITCARCGHDGQRHGVIDHDFCDRCMRDHAPATGYRSRTHRHWFVVETRSRGPRP